MRDSAVTDSSKRQARFLRTALLSAMLLLLLVALGACDEFERTSNVQIGMIENSGLNSSQARFQTLSGRKAWRENVDAGNTLTLDYEAEVEKGSLTLQIENPEDEVVWERQLQAGDSVNDQEELVAPESGTYTILIVGDGAGGSYELSWEEAE